MKTRPTVVHICCNVNIREGEMKEKGMGKKAIREKDVKKYTYIYFYANKNSEIMQRNFNPCRIEEITRT